MYKNSFLRKVSMVSAIVAIVSFTGIQSCSNEPDIPAPLDIPEEFNEVGKLHNECLDFVFEQIKGRAIESVKNPSIKKISTEGNDLSGFIRQLLLKIQK